MNTVNLAVKHEGRIMLEAVKVDSEGREIGRRLLADWFDNLITDIGLAAKVNEGWTSLQMVIGTGTSAPAFTDADMAQFKAQYYANSDAFIGNTSVSPYYGATRCVSQFPAGQATGIITEVGLCMGTHGLSDFKLLTRALIKDTNGNPTSVEVLSDEQLNITYDIRNYAPVADVVTTANIDGVDRTITIRPSKVGIIDSWRGNAGGGNLSVSNAYFGTVSLGTQFQEPGSTDGGINTAQGLQSGVNAYVNNTLYRDFWLKMPAGGAYDIGGFLFNIYGLGAYQVKIDPPVHITNTQSFKFTLRAAVSR